MIRPTRTAATIKPGDALPPAEKTFMTVDLVAYGGATWDWHRLHYDVNYARSMNLPDVLVDGQAFGAVLAKHALDWLGPRAFITRLGLKMRSMAYAGDTLRAEGEVTEIRPGSSDHDTVVIAQRLKNGDRIAAESITEVRLPR